MDMKPSRFTEEQIIGILREQEAGAKTAEHGGVEIREHRREVTPLPGARCRGAKYSVGNAASIGPSSPPLS